MKKEGNAFLKMIFKLEWILFAESIWNFIRVLVVVSIVDNGEKIMIAIYK